ncbi:phospholipid phosphatase-related protein type 4-like [Erpetoichthys calabaricus]|uniref:Phospholipid phosphatase-related protein type 4 n=1 Tax=Erpetoichthys calabaricus TaxID=27687 RepID=A0A8C4T283_ERPCA|nr:phospholipid phosphatase-related protein type 4-like [Erpetoichthys calabaricus]
MSGKDRQKGKLTKDSVTLLPCFYFVELPILASSVVSLYFLELTDVFKPVNSGFNCNDRSLSMPYIEPTHEVIPFLMLLSLAFAGPAVTIMIGEGILFCCLSKRRNGIGSEANINAGGCNFNSFLRRAVRFIGVHVFGLCATALITDIIQLSTGYQTPYFLTVCKPNYTSLNMSCEENAFIVEDICAGADSSIINAGRKSFPSQHATLASFAAVYVSMYFNATLTDSSKLLKPLLVFSFIICAIICGLTRIVQYKNHPIDVYCGFLIGGGIAVYLGLYAVGNFQPSEDGINQHSQRDPLRSLTDLNQDSSRHLQGKNGSSSDGISSHHAERILSRNHRESSSLTNLKRASADVEIITPRSPMGKENMVTFSNTLPRVNTPALEDSARRNATIHASMDSARSKQLLSQWKNKNENRKLSLQVMETEAGHSPQRTIEMRSSSEPAGVGVNGEHQGPVGQYLKIGPGSTPLPSNSSGIAGGARVSIQSRPGSSQLVHIPEETQENVSTSPKTSSARSKWLKVAEKSGACRTNNQPRIMQVIAMSKQQGLLQSSPKSSDGSTVSCTGAIRYKTLTDQEPGSIVRVEAHPENNRPVVQAPSSDGSGSWKWKGQEKGSIRQSYELNDLNRDSESSESLKDSYSSTDRKRVNPESSTEHHHHHHGITTIRVTPVEGSEVGSETVSIASSCDSTLRRKGNIILIPERSNSPDNTRNIFYKGTSPTRAFKE